MKRFDARKEIVGIDDMVLAYGLEKISVAIPSPLVTYLFAPRGGMIDGIVEVPLRSVVVIMEEETIRYVPYNNDISCIVMRAPRALPPLTQSEKAAIQEYGLSFAVPDLSEWHEHIKSYKDGNVLVMPKLRPDGARVKGWACNFKKGQSLSIDGGAEWTAVREAEQYHYHRITKEFYTGLHGVGELKVNDERVMLEAGHILYMEPGDKHRLTGITVGPLGIYSHLVAQRSPVKDDKIVVSENAE